MKFAQIEYLPVSHLNPATYNPRAITSESFAQLKSSIATYGFVQLVVVQKDGGNIIGGHQSVRAIIDIYKDEKRRGVPRVPCAIVDLNDRQARLLNVALNKIRGEFDMPKLATLMQSLDEESELLDEEIASIGFAWPELEPMLPEEVGESATGEADQGAETVELPPGFNLTVRFSSKQARDGVRAVLAAQGARKGVSLGDVLVELLLPDD
jgi:hypothetical protein